MKTALYAGLALGLFVTIWTNVMGVTGWYRDAKLQALFFAVVIFEIGAVVFTVLENRSMAFRDRLRLGATVGFVASPIVFVQSILFTKVIKPTYFEDIQQTYREILTSRGVAPGDVERQVAEVAATQTSLGNAATGAIATVFT